MCTKVSSFLKPLLFLTISGLSISLWSMDEDVVSAVTYRVPRRLCVSIEKYDKSRDFEAIKKISAEGSDYGIGMAALFMSGAVRVARISDMTVGFIDYTMYESTDLAPASAHVEYLGVTEALRGRGIGRQLLAYAMQDIASHGFNRIDLNVFRHDMPAIKLYESMGFVEKSARPKLVMRMVCSVQPEPKKASRRCSSLTTAFFWMTSWLPRFAKSHTE